MLQRYSIHSHAPPPAANTSKAAENAQGGGINALSEIDRAKFIDKVTGLEMEQNKEPQPLLEWLAENYQSMGAQLEFITNKSQEGSQFVKGFGGIGGLCRYKVDFGELNEQMMAGDDEDEFYDSDEDFV